MREKIAEKLYSILYNNPSKHNMKEFSRHLADQILSLPSGYIAGEHEIMVGEALEGYGKLYEACKEFVRKCEHGKARSVRSYKQMVAALTFTSERIRKPIPTEGK